MKTLRKLIYGEVIQAVALVTLIFVVLFFLLDFIEELQTVSRNGQIYEARHALLVVLFLIPNHLYELMPITTLIGAIFVMARLAQSSEFTILRTSGLGPTRALRTLLGLGVGFVLFTFLLGDYLSPWADRQAQLFKARYSGEITFGQTGAWLRERQGDREFAVNIARINPDGHPAGVRIVEFDGNGRWQGMTQAEEARVDEAQDQWVLSNVQRDLPAAQAATGHLSRQTLPQWTWKTDITSEMVSVALLKPERMRTWDLFQYIRHLDANGQSSQRFEIEFWRKVFYPISCLVMMVLALPFAYLHFRSGNITTQVFGGVMAGISFFLLNNAFGFMGSIHQWSPWLAAAAPGLIYSLFSLAAFTWLVFRQ
jgi:lipopolysaccharide export system permease protein